MITKFDKQTAKSLGTEIAFALQMIATKHGIEITYGGGTVGDTEFSCKVRCKVIDKDALAKKQRSDWDGACSIFDLTPDDYLRMVDVGRGKIVQLLGFELGRTKCPIRVRDLQTDKIMLYPETLTKMIIAQREKVSPHLLPHHQSANV